MFIGRNAPTVVANRGGTIFMNNNPDVLPVAGDGFINGVVNNFNKKVVKALSVGRTDIHSWSFSDRFKSFQNLNIAGGIAVFFCVCRHFFKTKKYRLFLLIFFPFVRKQFLKAQKGLMFPFGNLCCVNPVNT